MSEPFIFKNQESITIENIRKLPLLNTEVINGFEHIRNYFVDSSGFGTSDEMALTFPNFIKKIKKGFAYGITEAGQFQVYVGEFKPNKEKVYFIEEELKVIYGLTKSFYNKAIVRNDKGILRLMSYNTEVCFIDKEKATILNTQSQTTKRHIKEFLMQNGFNIDSIKQLIKDFEK